MTLEEFNSQFYSISNNGTIYVFNSGKDANRWINNNCRLGGDNNDYRILFTIHSDYRLSYVTNRKWCEAQVKQFFAVAQDKMVVVIEDVDDEFNKS